MEGERRQEREEERKKREEGVGETAGRTGREEDGMQTRVSTETADIESSSRKLS